MTGSPNATAEVRRSFDGSYGPLYQIAYLIGGHMAVAASGQGGLMLRCDPDDTDSLLQEPGAQEFEMRGKGMRGWLRVDAATVDDDDALRTWVERGVAYAGSLPPK